MQTHCSQIHILLFYYTNNEKKVHFPLCAAAKAGPTDPSAQASTRVQVNQQCRRQSSCVSVGCLFCDFNRNIFNNIYK